MLRCIGGHDWGGILMAGCTGRVGHAATTDANLVLGRILPEFFPKIFGKTEDQPLDGDACGCRAQ